MQYVRENHGDIFRIVAFSGMLDCMYDCYGTPEVERNCFISVRSTSAETPNGLPKKRDGSGINALFPAVSGSPDVNGSLCSETDEQKSLKSWFRFQSKNFHGCFLLTILPPATMLKRTLLWLVKIHSRVLIVVINF